MRLDYFGLLCCITARNTHYLFGTFRADSDFLHQSYVRSVPNIN